MAPECTTTFAELAARLGFSCGEAGGLVEFRNPATLENATLPILEVTVVVGAVLALIFAIQRLRKQHDPTDLVVWFGALAYLFVIEPPLYFPAAFGLDGHVDTMFAHNVFTVEFLWGRLPLYIVAIYPFMATLAFGLVRSLGIFERYGTLIGAACVGFVHHAFYEIFDHLGPQLRWWEWTLDNPLNQPMLDSVPMGSVVVFAALWPMSLAWCVQFFVGRHVATKQFSAIEITWRTIVVGFAASLGTFLLPLPATVLGYRSDTVRGALYAAELAILSAVAVYALVAQWRRVRAGAERPTYTNRIVGWYGVAYVVVLAGLWLFALPDYLTAHNGTTIDGDPVGNLIYTAACFAVAALTIAATFTAKPSSVSVATAARSQPA
ncbi:hypothetical protein [Nocardia camponoti]|uniref:Uncharacterized protein n=1 Tax=Nocardia camponoti TaxID=1616106 RepID=A0A917VEA2_9NOCA|nr:hypothetical protein [Nocardia camponoti]GGK67216.1 hypothetical protein GCM10011591_44200 [Nocardia camponoti]